MNNISKGVKKAWANPNTRKRIMDGINKTKMSKEVREARKNAALKRWSTLGYREKMCRINKEVHNRPEMIKKSRELRNKLCQNPEFIKKLSDSLMGHVVTEETAKKISEKVKLRYRDLVFLRWFRTRIKRKPNNAEKKLHEIIGKYGFRYVGDYSFWIDGKNPDFVHNSKNMIVEMFGTYWHKKEEESERIKHFQKNGYKAIVIWDDVLHDTNHIQQRIENFVEE